MADADIDLLEIVKRDLTFKVRDHSMDLAQTKKMGDKRGDSPFLQRQGRLPSDVLVVALAARCGGTFCQPPPRAL
jgi:hypothetical protein